MVGRGRWQKQLCCKARRVWSEQLALLKSRKILLDNCRGLQFGAASLVCESTDCRKAWMSSVPFSKKKNPNKFLFGTLRKFCPNPSKWQFANWWLAVTTSIKVAKENTLPRQTEQNVVVFFPHKCHVFSYFALPYIVIKDLFLLVFFFFFHDQKYRNCCRP